MGKTFNESLDGTGSLQDLIAGKTPTFTGWTNDPTDAANITDGDISTFCTTGNKVAGDSWQYAYFIWDLGAFYNVLVTAVGNMTATAGDAYVFVEFWDSSSWIQCKDRLFQENAKTATVSGALCSKVRLGIASDATATITPNIREFNVWRLQ